MSADLLKFLEKNYKTKVYSVDKVPALERVSTGIATLDMLLDGGLPLGRTVEIYGPESAGKTSISLAIARAFIEQGYDVLQEDLERHITRDDLVRNGLNVEEFVYSRPAAHEEAIDLALAGAEGGAKLIIIDSVAMLDSKSTQEKLENDSSNRSIGGRAEMLSRLKFKITEHIEQNRAVLIFINQLRDKVNSQYGGTDSPGGRAVKHLCSVRIKITHTVKDDKVPGKIISHIKVEKSKTSTAYLTCEVPILNGIVQRAEALIMAALKCGVLKLSGSYYAFTPDWQPADKYQGNFVQGKAKLMELVEQDPELYELLKSAVAKKIEDQANPEEPEDIEDDKSDS